MKLIRLTDDHYIFDAGHDIVPAQLDQLRVHWDKWWTEHPGEIPRAFIIGGSEVPVEYEDRRDSDLEARVKALEGHFHMTNPAGTTSPAIATPTDE